MFWLRNNMFSWKDKKTSSMNMAKVLLKDTTHGAGWIDPTTSWSRVYFRNHSAPVINLVVLQHNFMWITCRLRMSHQK